MSRRQGKSKGVKLPHALQQELGLEVHARGSGGRRRIAAQGNRKQQRRAGRIEKKAARAGGRQRTQRETVPEDFEDDDSSASHDKHPIDVPRATRLTSPAPKVVRAPPPKPKSILKRPPPQEWEDESEETHPSRASSPGLVLDRTSRTFKDRAAQDEADILALEKKLGLKNKKPSKLFEDDGLEDLLGGSGSEDESQKRRREADEWLQKKRRKAQTAKDEESEEGYGALLSESHTDQDLSGLEDSEKGLVEEYSGIAEGDTDTDEDDDFAEFESDPDEATKVPVPMKVRENPYVAPVDPKVPVGKYIPPSLRKRTDQDSEALTRLKRQVQGYLNKLSEANLISTLNEIEGLYQNNPRQDVTSTLIDLLLSLFCDRSALQATFVILHAAFIAGVYKVIGTDFGAETVSKLVQRFDQFHSDDNQTPAKETVNLVSLLSHLYTFHVINSTIVYDYIRLFLQNLNESKTELLLKVVRDCGPQLRQDDPSSLKSIVQLMQNATAKITADGKETSVRMKFMIEMITDLKNNKMRAAASSSGVASEHITFMRKVLGSLNSRNLRASEPLRISLNDIKDSDKKGKWWLVGASWKGNEPTSSSAQAAGDTYTNGNEMESQESDLLALARQYRMNTDVRRSIFVAIMSASDWQDAHLRLMKLRLKRSQEQEIPKVILRCAGAEEAYNPYYTLITQKLCSDKRLKMAFQFALWDFFKRMGEKSDAEEEPNEDEDEQIVELSEIVNLAKMYGALIADGSLAVGVLKTLNLIYLKDQAKTFVELLLVIVFTQKPQNGKAGIDEKRLSNIFGRAADTPQIIQGLQYFIKSHVRHSDLVSKKERPLVKRRCKLAADILNQVATSQGG